MSYSTDAIIREKILWTKLSIIESDCQMVDPKMSRMKITQRVSELAYEGKIPAVFYDNANDCYRLLPEKYAVVLRAKTGSDWRRLYTAYKKKAVREERIDPTEHKPIPVNTITEEKSFWKSIGKLFKF